MAHIARMPKSEPCHLSLSLLHCLSNWHPTGFIVLIFEILCLIVVVNLHATGQQTWNDTVMCQFILISLEVSARLLYSDLERMFKEDKEKQKSQKNPHIATYLWITLEILILCSICVAISYILVQQAPHSPFTYLKTLEG